MSAASVAGAEFLRRPSLQRLLGVLNGSGGEARIAGGAVRDALIGRPVSDVDLATTLLPAEVTLRAGAAGLRVVPTGIRFGTVTVLVDGDAYEVTTLRRDLSTDGRRAVVAWGADWAEDARRRDFTMNALFCDGQGAVLDAVGGAADAYARRVRFIGDADTRLAEDHLRALRFFRFHAQLGLGPPDTDGFRAVVRARPLVRALSAERIWQELAKLLVASRASDALEGLAETGILSDAVGVADLARCACLRAIEAAHGIEPSPARRLAAVAVRTAEDAVRLSARLRLSQREGAVLAMAARHAPALAGGWQQTASVRYAAGAWYRDVVLVAWAGTRAGTGDERWRERLAQASLPKPVPPVRGADVLARGVPPGPAVGRLVAEAERRWLESGFQLDRDTLLAAILPEPGPG